MDVQRSVNKKLFVGTCVSIGVGISVKIDGRQTDIQTDRQTYR